MQTDIDMNNHDIINFSKLIDLENKINSSNIERILKGKIVNGLFKDTSNNFITDILNNTNIHKIILFNNGQTKRINIRIRFRQNRLNPVLTIPNITLNTNSEEIEKLTNLNIVSLRAIRTADDTPTSTVISINNVDFILFFSKI